MIKIINPQKRQYGFALLGLLLTSELCAEPQSQKPKAAAVVGESVVSVDALMPDDIDEGYLFWHQADEIATDVENYAMLLDADGKAVHRWDTDLTGGGHTSYILSDGGLLRMGIRNRRYVKGQPVVATDVVQITDRTGKAVWELSAKDLSINGNKITFHHDLTPLPNGNILILIYEEIDPDQAASHGWYAGNGKTVWSDGVIEIKPRFDDGSFEVVWIWRFIDHIVQARDKGAPNYGVIAEHPQRIDAHFPKSYAPMNAVRQHLNSIDYHPELDQILLSSFIYNEIWVIDHSTTTAEAAASVGGKRGKGGDLLFRYGNPAAYGRGNAEDRLFRKQHDANWINAGLPGAGNILVFNNNTDLRGFRLPQRGAGGAAAALAQERLKGESNVYEILPAINAEGYYYELDGKAPYRAQRQWFWEYEEFFAPFQGGARRLPNGNTLISDTVGRRVWEITSDGQVAARYKGPAPTFKSFKYRRDQIGEWLTQ